MVAKSNSIGGLSTNRLKLLKLILDKRPSSDTIPKRSTAGPAPLSFAQQRVWFLDQLEPGSPLYSFPGVLRLKGKLNVAALERAVNEIVRRHEALRTVFSASNGSVVQTVKPARTLQLPMIDLHELPVDQRDVVARSLRGAEARRPFDLIRGPLLRVQLIRESEENHVLLLTMHHIVSDGWSVGVMVRELVSLYGAYAAGAESELEELAVQYGDYAEWQRGWLSGEVLEQQLGYWRKQLAGMAVLELPADYGRPAVQRYRGAHLYVTLAVELEKLKAQSQRLGVTLYMSLLAAFGVVLSRYSGQTDVAVGTAIAGRNRAETEKLIGLFVNTLVMRLDLSGEPSFVELLRRVREVSLGAYGHQDVPFEKLVEELQWERDLSRSPLYQVMMILQNTPGERLELPGLQVSMVGSDTGTAKLDLVLSVAEGADALKTHWEYNTDLFTEETIRRSAEHYGRVVTAMVAAEEELVSEVRLLSEAEAKQLESWQGKVREYAGRSVVEMFEAQARERGEAIAVEEASGARLSYRELNERANQLAEYLRGAGVKSEEVVGLCLERSLGMVVGMLGIWKAGGAYLPLEWQYPAARKEMMVREAGVRVLLTEEKLLEAVPVVEKVFCLDRDEWQWQDHSVTNAAPVAGAENLAYVIYTSGSSGLPKGVLVSHRNLMALLAALHPQLAVEVDDVWTMSHSYAFDFSVWEVWGALLSGARLLIVPPQILSAPAELRQFLRDRKATLLSLTPSVMSNLISEVGPASLANTEMALRQLVVGGEATSRELAVELLQTGLPIWNFYGPTEGTVWTAAYRVTDPGRTIPIGQPLANSQLYILDGRHQQVPVGVVGELYIGGANLSRGYMNRADLTAEKFVPHPFSAERGARLYKTGDLARYLADGNIEFLGRADYQVKIRGYRIEIGEIESALMNNPDIRDCAVVAREDKARGRFLVAYFVPARQPGGSISELKSSLRQKLPDYMIPSVWVELDQIPLTTNRKVNRQALITHELDRVKLTDSYSPPNTPVEELLVGIWQQLLGVSRVGIDDNFFELGGHSLLATQLMSRVREVCGVEVGLRRLFEAPTVRELAECVDQELGAEVGLKTPALERVSRGEPLPLSFAQQRLWFLDQLEPNSPAYNIPVRVRISGTLNVGALEKSLSEVIRRHESLRTVFEKKNGEAVQMVSTGKAFIVPLVDLECLTEEQQSTEAKKLTEAVAQLPFDLAGGLLIRVCLLRLNSKEHVALLTVHHIVSDGWSMTVLLREVAALYEAFSAGKPSPLPDLLIQYADFAMWQREWLDGEQLETQLAYWRNHLAGTLPVLALPTDRPRSSMVRQRGGKEKLIYSTTLRDSLNQLGQREGATLYMVMLAAFYVLLARYSGQTDIVIGTDVANRNRSETENLIGFFVNQLVLRANLSDNPRFCDFLKQVRELTLMAYTHQDLPYEKVVAMLNPDRAVSRNPLFQAKIVYQNVPRGNFELPGSGLVLTPADTGEGNGVANFDLLLSLMDTTGGLQATLEYSADLFDRTTIERMLENYEVLLGSIVAQPDAVLDQLKILTPVERKTRDAERQSRAESKFKKFKSIKPRTVSLAQGALVKADFLSSAGSLPLVLRPAVDNVDLAEWMRNNLNTMDHQLLKYGGILFRGFNLNAHSRFEEFLEATSVELMSYREKSSPRTRLSDKVYTSTEYPADETIFLHNELSYALHWPMKIWFYCLQPAQQRGQTPVADVRKVFQRINPKIRERFAERKWMLVRNFGDGFSLDWRDSFRFDSKVEVEKYCQDAQIDCEWKDRDRLRTRQVRSAVTQHPKTGEWVWFNHIAFWHVSSLRPAVRDAMLASVGGEDELPYNTYYGDGSPIENSVIDEIREAYEAEKIEFEWDRGDVLMLDNMLIAHGRTPFVGPRRVMVAMGEAFTHEPVLV